VKGRPLIWGDLAQCLKGRRDERSEKSAEAVVVPPQRRDEGLNRRKSKGNDESQRHTASDVRATGATAGKQG
jgi:hypothetical protein